MNTKPRAQDLKNALALLLALAAAPAAGAEPPAMVQDEVRHLLAYIEESGCEFFSNGTWANSRTAQMQVRSKFDSLARQDRIRTTRDFIDKAAVQSGPSSKPYLVRCGLKPPVASDLWLSDELARFQAQRR